MTKTTYLSEYRKYKTAYLPIGTIEWHGEHLPIETDFLVAQKLCEMSARVRGGLLLPPFYLGTDKVKKLKGAELRGMDRHLGKRLPGSVYYLTPKILYAVMKALADNLFIQGFQKVFIITGHAGTKQIETMQKLAASDKRIVFINPYGNLSFKIDHAGEGETSIFWACYPNEIARSMRVKISKNDDYVKYKGYDPRTKASLKLGKKLLKEMFENCLKLAK